MRGAFSLLPLRSPVQSPSGRTEPPATDSRDLWLFPLHYGSQLRGEMQIERQKDVPTEEGNCPSFLSPIVLSRGTKPGSSFD